MKLVFTNFLKCWLLVGLVAISSFILAQNKIVVKSFVKSGDIFIRFLPNNYNSLSSCTKEGYSIKRIIWNEIKNPVESDFENNPIILATNLIQKESPEWNILISKYPEAGLLFNFLFESNNNKGNLEMVFGLTMLSCDFNIELAKAAGLYFKDEGLSQNKYAYLIQPANTQLKKNIKSAIIVVDNTKDDFLKDIDSLKITTRKKEVKLTWNEEELQSYYPGYFIERSTDGKNFSTLNKKPHIQIATQYETNKKDITYNDTIVEYGKTYFYRVRGLSFFGLYGNYSNIVQCKLTKPLDDFPIVDSTSLVDDTTLNIFWHMPKNVDLNDIKGYNIYKSESINGFYSKTNKVLLLNTSNSFLDFFPKKSNYYKIVAYNIYGDSATSHHILGLIPDKKPPSTPTGLTGKIDSLGNVKLSWNANKENDLMGYRVFRNNSENEELTEVTKTILNGTIFKDSITLETLTENIFYSVTAVDSVFNNSEFSKSLKLKRPDKIKPVEALFKTIVHNDTSIILKWIPSTSKDVSIYELLKKSGDSDYKKIKEWKATYYIDSLVDSKLEYATYYSYQIKVIDNDGNFSTSFSAPHYYDSRVRKAIKIIKYAVDKEKKVITLNWEYPEKELYNFVIYKAKKDEPLKIIKTLKSDTFTFKDNNLNIGNKYVYRIKANFNSGAESFISEEIIIDF